MNEQRRELISSRHNLEDRGEVFGCADCGAELPLVEHGHVGDFCESCEAKFMEEDNQ